MPAVPMVAEGEPRAALIHIDQLLSNYGWMSTATLR